MTPRAALATACALAALALPRPVTAHGGGTTGLASIAVDGSAVRYGVTLWPGTLPEPVATDLTERPERVAAVVREKIAVSADGRRCAAGEGAGHRVAADRVTLAVTFACAAPVRELTVRDDLFDVLGPDHHTLARIDAPGHAGQFAFASEMREMRVSLGGGGARGLGSFVRLGVEHILTGWDHLVFLLALLLPGGGLVALAKIVTAFTAAHSVTLSLAVLDVVTLPDRFVEATIALSIAAVAVENLYLAPSARRRWMLSFAFGLVHGFGFSSVLREIGLPPDGVLLSLLGFNGGVEVGQAVVVAAALPLMMAVRKTGYETRMVRGSSLAILVTGVALFVGRALL